MSNNLNVKEYKKNLEARGEDFWIKKGEKMALDLFREASRRVPAYKDFLKKNKINPASIKTITDFKLLPQVNKKNYLKAYPLEKLCWDGNTASSNMISLSSGSSGEPFFWPRRKSQANETALSHEVFLVDSFEIDRHSTLFIVSFSMGMWIAGTLTYSAVQDIASHHDMTVITPGINKHDVLNVIKNLGPKYSQIIIAGYPPFIKDIIDEGETVGINWKKMRVKFLFAAEAFGEKWRDYIYSKTGSKNPYKDSLNIYGTADALILGHETPLSIYINRKAAGHPDLYKDIFYSEERVPTLVQYNPEMRFFENEGGQLIFSCLSGIPLVRYNIGDKGKVIKFSDMAKILADNGIVLKKEARKNKLSIWQLPFVYVFGRDDFTASLYGINIFPENIRDALSNFKVDDFVSGKFKMIVKRNEKHDPYLEVNVELKNQFTRIPEHLEAIVKDVVFATLKEKSTEYNELYKSIGKRAEPQINLCLYDDERFFKSGNKQKWHGQEG